MTVHVTGSGPHECKTARRKNLKLADSLAGQFGHIYSKNQATRSATPFATGSTTSTRPEDERSMSLKCSSRYRKRVPDNH